MRSKKSGSEKARTDDERSIPFAAGLLPLRVGLTGNIGSGKSLAAKLFAELGVPTYDTDKVGHELLRTDPRIREMIVSVFGEQILEGGVIHRGKLGSIVFNSPGRRKDLESILHPAIMSAVNEMLDRSVTGPYAVIEVPLLYEAELSEYFDYIVLVKADKKHAIRRAASHLGLQPAEVVKRLNAQIPQSEKEKLADFSMSNNGTPEDLRLKVSVIHRILTSLASTAAQDR